MSSNLRAVLGFLGATVAHGGNICIDNLHTWVNHRWSCARDYGGGVAARGTVANFISAPFDRDTAARIQQTFAQVTQNPNARVEDALGCNMALLGKTQAQQMIGANAH